MLWCCLHFPNFALEVFPRENTAGQPAVCIEAGRQQVVVACNAAARDCGISTGLTLSAARVLCPELHAETRDSARETRALEGVGLVALHYTPSVSLEPPLDVLLEVGGCLRYFKGLDGLLEKLREQTAVLGYGVQVAVAPTAAAARLFARAGRTLPLTRQADLAQALGPFPVGHLDIPADAIRALQDMGVASIAECLALPRAGLARRLGQRVVDELDRLHGQLPEARAWFPLPESFARSIEFPGSIDDAEALLFPARRLVHEAAGWLLARGLGAGCLRIGLQHERASVTSLRIGLQPSRDGGHILSLLREQLARCDLPASVTGLELAIEETTPLSSGNLELDLSDGPAHATRPVGLLLDRLRARLGDDAVVGLQPVPDHRPERACDTCRPEAVEPAIPPHAPVRSRPLWLMAQPEPLGEAPAKILAGPERIETGWWDDGDVTRDYYILASTSGARWWVFRERRQGDWFIHGFFG